MFSRSTWQTTDRPAGRSSILKMTSACFCLRMNGFGVLARAPRKSVVSASDQFFNQPFPSQWVRQTPVEEVSPFMTYADEFTIRLVRVIADFFGGDLSVTGAGLEALEFHPSGKEKSNEDKLLL